MSNFSFNREPALLIGLAAAIIQVVSSFAFPLSVEQQGTLNAVVVAVFGLATAASVAGDKLVPAILGGVQALVACALAFGLDLSPEKQGTIMLGVAALVSVVIRDRVVAKAPLVVE